MLRFFTAGALAAFSLISAPADAQPVRSAQFLSHLNRSGSLSAGWVQVLPILATACNFRLDNSQLTTRLIDLSYQEGNSSYTRDLYTTLYRIENHREKNGFVQAWTERFGGDQQAACATAAALWGEEGHQFPGVLKQEASSDGTGGVTPAVPAPNCR